MPIQTSPGGRMPCIAGSWYSAVSITRSGITPASTIRRSA